MVPSVPMTLEYGIVRVVFLAWAAAAPQDRSQEAAARIEDLLRRGEVAKGLAEADAALVAAPGSRPVRTARARCLFERGDFPAAEALLSELLGEISSGSPEDRAQRPALLVRLAEVHLAQGDHERAAKAALEAAGSAAPAAAPARASGDLAAAAGGVLLRARRYGAALPLLERAVESDPRSHFRLWARGVARARTGDLRGAVEDLARAAEEPALRFEAKNEMGLALSKLGEHARAAAALLEALAIDPWQAEACYALAQEMVKLRKPRVAGLLHRYFEALRETEGTSSLDHHLAALGRPVDASIERARRYERLGRYEKVFEELHRLRRMGESAAAAQTEAEFWRRAGVDEPARRAAALIERARKALAAGRGEEGYRLARLAVALEPRSSEALRTAVAAHAAPADVLPRIHFLTRLAAIQPADAAARAALEEARRAIEGES